MTFSFPIAFALPILYLAARLLRRGGKPSAIAFPSASFLRTLPRSLRLRLRGPVFLGLEVVCIISLTLAAARPQVVTTIEQPRKSRNIMFVIDTSNSMSAEDFPTSMGRTSRMEGVKTVVAEYVKSRHHDRIGLVVFGNTSYLQSPLTSDTSLVERLVQALQPRMAGDGTAIGDGLGLALKRLRNVDGSSKAIILITDGVNTAGQITPLRAAEVAKDLGVQVHTIGIGSGQAPLGNLPLGGIFAGPGQIADFDETTLRQVAQLTGGVYFNATSLEGLQDVYRQIDKLAETEGQDRERSLVEELFPPFSLVALIALLAAITLSATVLRRIP